MLLNTACAPILFGLERGLNVWPARDVEGVSAVLDLVYHKRTKTDGEVMRHPARPAVLLAMAKRLGYSWFQPSSESYSAGEEADVTSPAVPDVDNLQRNQRVPALPEPTTQ